MASGLDEVSVVLLYSASRCQADDSPGLQGLLGKAGGEREQRGACQRCAASAAGVPGCGTAAPGPPGWRPAGTAYRQPI